MSMDTKPTISRDALREHSVVTRQYLELRVREARYLAAREDLVRVPCLFCGSVVSDAVFTRDGFHYKACASCGSIFATPRPSRAALEARRSNSAAVVFWRERVRPTLRQFRDVSASNLDTIHDALGSEISNIARVVDVGCGDGDLLARWRDTSDTDLAGIEPDSVLASEARARALPITVGTVEESRGGSADLVTCFDVIEHAFDPIPMLQGCRENVRGGGLVLVTAPNAAAFSNTTLWEKSFSIFPPDHLNIPTRVGLTRAVERSGLSVVRSWCEGGHELETIRSAVLSDESVVLPRSIRALLMSNATVIAAFEQVLKVADLGHRVVCLARRPTGRRLN